jgi:hypothetical protein
MDSSRNFRSIGVIIFVTSLRLILLIDLERESKSFTSRSKLLKMHCQSMSYGELNKLKLVYLMSCTIVYFFINSVKIKYDELVRLVSMQSFIT